MEQIELIVNKDSKKDQPIALSQYVSVRYRGSDKKSIMLYTSNWIKLRFLILSSHPSPLGSDRHIGCNQIAVSSSGEYREKGFPFRRYINEHDAVLLKPDDQTDLSIQSVLKI